MIKMQSGNYCKVCGHRILPNEPYCTGCGAKTGFDASNIDCVLTPPIHNIGFFNFQIDFSPYIITKNDFKYEICSCGYLNDINNEFCYMCGAKRSESKLDKFLKRKSKPQFSFDNVLCECGAINSKENVYCEMCGKQLKEDTINSTDNYSNFNLQFKDSIFCFCGEENEKFAQFCRNCGLPLSNYGSLNDMAVLCTCSTLNEVTSDFCIECGNNLKREDKKIVCVCGHRNSPNLRFCENCERPLNPQRNVKTRIVCSCGQILDWDSDFCPNCGKNIKSAITRRNSVDSTVKSLKKMFRQGLK
ncbi:MAG: zinc ribbon domain-containing protein [Methanobrevibacter sp.]|nr:zinc ribbon domain-containing protein [Methanobrevibacter sp.]